MTMERTLFFVVSFIFLLLHFSEIPVDARSTGDSRTDGVRLEIRPTGPVQTIQAGKSFVLNCMGVGSEANMFSDLTWYNPRGERIESGNDFSTTLTNAGDKQMLVFRNPRIEDDGVYRCKGYFARTNPLEVEVTISVFEGITFEDCPETQALVKGKGHEVIRCKARSKPRADVTWIKNEEQLDTLRYSPDYQGLQIRGYSDERDSGTYIIMAAVTDTGLVETKEIKVEVHVRPEIVDFNTTPDAIEGDRVTLDCKARATPHAFYSWLDHRGRNLTGMDGYVVNENSGEMIIESVTRDMNQGPFTCVAGNAAGEDRQKAYLKIITKPVITRMDSISLPEGKDSSITCTATGNPLPTLTIRKEGDEEPLSEGLRPSKVSDSVTDTESRIDVTMYGVTRADSALYICKAENQAGSVEQAGHLQVEYRPDLSKTNRQVMSWMNNVVNMTCLVDAIPNATLHWYDVKSTRLSSSTNPSRYRVFPMISEGKTILQVTCNEKDVYSTYRCQAENTHGETDVFISLKEAFVPGVIPQYRLVKKSPQSVTFKLEDPLDDGGLPVSNYNVYYRDVTSPGSGFDPRNEWRKFTWSTQGVLDKSYFLDGLASQSLYEFEFTAQNSVGEGPRTEKIREQLPLESQPEPVPITREDQIQDDEDGSILSRYSRSFTLKWTEPQDNGRKIQFYDIKYYKVKKADTLGDWIPEEEKSPTFHSVAAGDELTYTLTELEPSTYYRVEISAKNELGSSHPASLVFKTADYRDASDLARGTSQTVLVGEAQLMTILLAFALTILIFFVIMDLVCCCSLNTGLTHLIFSCCCSGPSSKASKSSSTRRNLRSGSSSSVDEKDPMGFDDHDQPLNQSHQQQQHPSHLLNSTSPETATSVMAPSPSPALFASIPHQKSSMV